MAKNAVALKGKHNVPAHIKAAKPQGRGVSTDAADNLVPMGRILQKMSNEVDKKTGQYIKGAEVGDIYIKNMQPPIIKGDDGFLFQPCFFQKGFVEWIPRGKGGGGGKGFVKMHKAEPDDCETKKDPANPERTLRIRKSNGNVVVETRYHGGFMVSEDGVPSPLMLPFASSGHTVAKGWMGMMNRKLIDGVKADSWYCYYRLKSVSKTVGDNTWSLFEVTDAGPEEDGVPTTMWAPTTEDLDRGEALAASLASGAKAFDASDVGGDESEKM